MMELPSMSSIDREVRKTLLWMRDNVSHENVLKFYGLTAMDKERFIISEFCQKGALNDILQDDKLNLNENSKFSLAFDIGSGMSFLHSIGIIHGSLKSSCCLIDSRWTVKVADWEYNKLYSRFQTKGQRPMIEIRKHNIELNGEYAQLKEDFWVAPEILRKEHMIDPTMQSDVYSYSIVLQEIFTREDPFYEVSDLLQPKDVIDAIKNNHLRPQHSDDTPVKVRQLMEIAWAEDYITRPPFETCLKMLKNANPSRKSVLDHMMEVMEEYSHHLEERIEERSVELDIAKNSVQEVIGSLIPPSAALELSSGETVTPRRLESVTFLQYNIVNYTELCGNLDPSDALSYINELTTLIDGEVTRFDNIFRIESTFNEYQLVTGLDGKHSSENVVDIATCALNLIAAINKKNANAKVAIRTMAAMHTGPVTTMVVGCRIPQFVVCGETTDILSKLTQKAVANNVLVSQTTYNILHKKGKLQFKQHKNLKEYSLMSYWLVGSEHFILEIDPIGEEPSPAKSASPLTNVDC